MHESHTLTGILIKCILRAKPRLKRFFALNGVKKLSKSYLHLNDDCKRAIFTFRWLIFIAISFSMKSNTHFMRTFAKPIIKYGFEIYVNCEMSGSYKGKG